MLEKDIILTPTLQTGKKLDMVSPVDKRAPNDKNGAPKLWWNLSAQYLLTQSLVELSGGVAQGQFKS